MYGSQATGLGGFTTPVTEAMEDVIHHDGSAGGAAISVGVMIAVAAAFLAILKRSGFRAMIAVGRG